MSGSPAHVVVIGGGISGLATVAALRRGIGARGLDLRVTLLEAGPRLGGNIRTEHHEGFVIDAGPDSFVALKPEATALCKAVGLGERLIETRAENRRVYIVRDGRLQALPEGLFLGIPVDWGTWIKTPLVSWAGKLRALRDFLPGGLPGDGDVSLGGFLAGRLGTEMVDVVLEPVLGGVYAGDASALSLRATFPQLLQMVEKSGGLFRGARAAAAMRKASPGASRGMFLSLHGGMMELVDALEKAIGPDVVRLSSPVARVARADGGLVVETASGERIAASHVVVATQARVAAELLGPLSGELGEDLAAIPYVSTATVFFAMRRDEVRHPLDASGFVVPRRERRSVIAATWVTSKWPHRAPDGMVLMRAFLGGAGAEGLVDLDDAELVARARADLFELVGATGEPLFTRVHRYVKASPQPVVGHLDRMKRVWAAVGATPGLELVGNVYDGVGIPDSVRVAERAAGRILDAVTPKPA